MKLMLYGHTLSGEYVFSPLRERAFLEAGDSLLSPYSRPAPALNSVGTWWAVTVGCRERPGLSLGHVLLHGEWLRGGLGMSPVVPSSLAMLGVPCGRSLQLCITFRPWGFCSCCSFYLSVSSSHLLC